MAEKLTDNSFEFDDKEQKEQKEIDAERASDKKSLKAFLDGLGDDRKAVYKTLKKLGVKGVPNLPNYDPTAVALKQYFSCDLAYISNGIAVMAWDQQEGEQRSVTCGLPDAVMEFVVAFDNREYRKLEFDLDKAIKKAGRKHATS